MSNNHMARFLECFPNPPAQPAVGDDPRAYLRKLNHLSGLTLEWPASHPTGQLSRVQLRELCRDPKVDVLIAYAAVMAWGRRGVDSRNYRLSLDQSSRSALIEVLTYLRNSRQNRLADFDAMQRAARGIPGLGISFYTKLLFFFRQEADAYILDQFTAKSATLLFDQCRIVLTSSGYPAPDNFPAAYEWFCASAEFLAREKTASPAWTGERIEQAMFDIRGGSWRNYVRSQFGDPALLTGKSPQTKSLTSPGTAGTTACHKLAIVIASAHREVLLEESFDLPGENPTLSASTPVRVNCGSRHGINWQYDVQQGSVHAKVFIAKQHRERYDAFCERRGITDDNFGDGVAGTGFKEGKTCAIKCTVARGASAPESDWNSIAREAVLAMHRLFECIGEDL